MQSQPSANTQVATPDTSGPMPRMPRGVMESMIDAAIPSGDSSLGARLEAMFRMIVFSEPRYVAEEFVTRVGAVDRSEFGVGEVDPVERAFSIALSQASPPFWDALTSEVDCRPLIARIRNWLAHMVKIKAKDRTVPALEMLRRIPVSNDVAVQTKLPPVLRILSKEHGKVGALAKEFSFDESSDVNKATHTEIHRQQPSVQSAHAGKPLNGAPRAAPAAAPAPAAAAATAGPTPTQPAKHESTKLDSKLFSALSTHKRPVTEVSAANSTASASSEKRPRSPDYDPNTDTMIPESKRAKEEQVPIKAKPKKSVRWKSEPELVSVRYFETENLNVRSKSFEQARELEQSEGSRTMHPQVQWAEPLAFETGDAIPAKMQTQMGVKRAGYLKPVSAEADAQAMRESSIPPAPEPMTSDSPSEPPAFDQQPDSDWQPRYGQQWKSKQAPPPPAPPAPNPWMPMMYPFGMPSMPSMPNMPGMVPGGPMNVQAMQAMQAMMNPGMMNQFGTGR